LPQISCDLCQKKLSKKELRTLEGVKDGIVFRCGSELISDSHPDKCVIELSAKIVVNTTIKCWNHVEFAYYSKTTGKTFALVCCWCAKSPSSEALAQREDRLTEIATCLPLCSDISCRKKGWISRGKRKVTQKSQVTRKKKVKTKIAAQKSVLAKRKAGSGPRDKQQKLTKPAKVTKKRK
jgi:hypothetical protein